MDDTIGDHLAIAYAPSPDDFYALATVSARANGFAGRSSIWLTPEALATFAAALSAYPLDPSNRPTLIGGYGPNPQTGAEAEDHVRLEAQPVGPYGQVALVATLLDPSSPAGRPRSNVTLELLTTYQRLGAFARDVVAISKGEVPAALLGAELLATG